MLLRVIRATQAEQQSSSARQTCRHLDQRYAHRSHKLCCSKPCTCFRRSAPCILSASSHKSVDIKIYKSRGAHDS